MTQWRRQARELLASGEPLVLVRVSGVRGSTPREVGAAMLVGRHATLGTIGGGQLEYRCTGLAADMLARDPRGEFTRRFPLGADCGQCCGGVVDVTFEDLRLAPQPLARLEAALPARDFRVAVFGAGHVGSAVVALLSMLDASIRWIDSRRDVFPGSTGEGVETLTAAEPAREIAALAPGTHVLVMTHSHPLDFDICAEALMRGDLGFVGLIGSRSKRRRFEKRFRTQGVDAADRLVCPIGIEGIDGKTPAEIAVAVSAQLLRLRAGRKAARKPSLRAL